MEFSTPKPPGKVCGDLASRFTVPSTPLLKRIGFGTGVCVYHFDRSPKVGQIRSPWALKKLNRTTKPVTSYADRLRKEADILKSLSHPNIVGFRGFVTTEDGREVLAMEECTSCLGNLIETRREMLIGPYESNIIHKVTVGVFKALDYLHREKKILHGDIKSYNVLIQGDFERAKLCDFGVSSKLNEKGEVDNNRYIGTVCWCPPEALFKDEGPITPKADIFAAGLIIWEMLALCPPHSQNFVTPETDNSLAEELSEGEEENYGTRPPLDDMELGPEYSTVIDIFNSCTEQESDKRPSAFGILSKLRDSGIVEG